MFFGTAGSKEKERKEKKKKILHYFGYLWTEKRAKFYNFKVTSDFSDPKKKRDEKKKEKIYYFIRKFIREKRKVFSDPSQIFKQDFQKVELF